MRKSLYAFDEQATAERARELIADNLRTRSRVECPTCGMTATAEHRIDAPTLPCPRCDAPTWRYEARGD